MDFIFLLLITMNFFYETNGVFMTKILYHFNYPVAYHALAIMHAV
jgi:hypothetical protein